MSRLIAIAACLGMLSAVALADRRDVGKGKLSLTATDHDGAASVRTDVFRKNETNGRWHRVIDERYTRDGKCEYSLAPGVYHLLLRYKEATPVQTRIIADIEITDKGVVEKQAYFEKGTLSLTASDHDGGASVRTDVFRKNDDDGRWHRVIEDRHAREGKCEYALAPGVYQLRMRYKGANPAESRTIDDIRIADKSAVEKQVYFEKGTLRLTATDHDGWAAVKTNVFRWDERKRRWDRVIDARKTRDGKCYFSLAPGMYQLRMWYQETSASEPRTIDRIRIEDKNIVEKEEYFERGTLRLIATDRNGWASVETEVYQWNRDDREWDRVIEAQETRDGRCDYTLAPGLYQLRMRYEGALPTEERTREAIRIRDKATISIGERFGGGNLPPLLSAAGPFEIGDGDGDGTYETGERVLFRMDIRDDDLDSIDFLINDNVLRTTASVGRYEQILRLSVPGDYRFAVQVRDRNGALETYEKVVPVIVQRQRHTLKARRLPHDYAQKRSLTRCPKCGKEFSQDMQYCPYDGTKLERFEKVLHGPLDASLVDPVEPGTPDAENAKLGLDWLDPFSDQEQTDQRIQRLDDDVKQR